jgi:hypothetical protein
MIARPLRTNAHSALRGGIVVPGALPWDARSLPAAQYSSGALLGVVGSTCKLLLDHNPSTITLVSGRVSSWADQSGNGFDVTMGTANMRPDGTTTINGLLAPGFSNGDGTQDRLDGSQAISGILSASAWHAFVVFRLTSHTVADGSFYDEELLVADSSGFEANGAVSVGGVHAGVWDGGLKQTARTSLSDATDYLLESSLSGGTLSHKLGAGAAVTVASGNISTLTGTIRLGDRSSTGHLQGRIAFVMLCNTALSAAQVSYVRAYCSAIYGVAS